MYGQITHDFISNLLLLLLQFKLCVNGVFFFFFFSILGFLEIKSISALDTWVKACCFVQRALLSAIQATRHSPLCSFPPSSWGLPGWGDRQLHCSDRCRNCPACSHSNRCAGLFHREKEKHGSWLPVFLVQPAWFALSWTQVAASHQLCQHVSLLFLILLISCV